MRFAWFRKWLYVGALGLIAAGLLSAQQKINPHTQIRWPGNCTAANMVYSFVLNACIANGTAANPAGTNLQMQYNNGGVFGAYTPAQALSWMGAIGVGGGTLTGPLNGTSANFSGTVSAAGAVSAPNVNGVITIPPSGDTTGAADRAALIAAISTGGEIKLKAGDYHVNGVINVSVPVKISGIGAATTIWNHSATANIFNINYQIAGGSTTAQGHGAILRDFDVAQYAGVTPTAGCAFNVASASGAGFYVTGLHIEDIHIYNTWRGVCTSTGVISVWFNHLYMSNEGDAGIYLDSTSPSGDFNFNSVEMSGPNTGVKINRCDTLQFTDLKLNGTPFLFTHGGNCYHVRILNPSFEGTVGQNCGVDFGVAGGTNPSGVQIWGGGIGLMQNALCNTANEPDLIYSFQEYSVGHTGWVQNAAPLTGIFGGNVSGTVTIDRYNGEYQQFTPTAAVTFAPPIHQVDGWRLRLEICTGTYYGITFSAGWLKANPWQVPGTCSIQDFVSSSGNMVAVKPIMDRRGSIGLYGSLPLLNFNMYTNGTNLKRGSIYPQPDGLHFSFDSDDALTSNDWLAVTRTALAPQLAKFSEPVQASNFTATTVAPTVAAAQIGYGATVVANTFCGTLSGAAGCVVINVAGTARYLPYW